MADARAGQVQAFFRVSIGSVHEALRDAGGFAGHLFGYAHQTSRQ
ncbi:hypothetical protein YPPY88_2708 [Yersinia pestis PY-88]|nr:hypothetical protein YPPY88_2708 [Yersinia pestis PY-88]